MGPGERSVEELIRYRLGDSEATRRACAAATVRGAASLAPIVMAVLLLRRLGWAPSASYGLVAGVLVVLIVTRALVGYARMRRKLRALTVTVGEKDIRVETSGDGYSIPRERVARVVEIAGSLGGLRVESLPDARTGVVLEAHVPRGGTGYAEVRGRLESWGPVDRRGRRGPVVRVAIGALVVVGIFFVPFVLEDFVARSRVIAAVLVGGLWIAMRFAMRRQ